MAKTKTPRVNSKKNGNSNELQPASEAQFQVSPEVKAEFKQNVVPINLEDEIRRRAYEIFEERGRVAGDEHEDWLRAEREVVARYRQQSA